MRSQHIYSFLVETLDAPDTLAGIMNEKRPDKLKMNTVEFLLQNLNGWLRKKTQVEFMSAGEIISIKCLGILSMHGLTPEMI